MRIRLDTIIARFSRIGPAGLSSRIAAMSENADILLSEHAVVLMRAVLR